MEKYKQTQRTAYRIIKNTIKSNKIGHAYLIEKNGFKEIDDFVKSFIISIIQEENTDQKKIINSILKDESPDIYIVETEGKNIKKEQIIDLQIEFKKTPSQIKYKFYVIKDVSKLNDSSANSLLKFLEEPEENIIAILLIDDIYKCLKTITSRCQIISLKQETDNLDAKKILNIKEEDYEQKMNCVLNFINFNEEYKMNSICKTSEILTEFKDNINLFLNIIELFYKEIFNLQIRNKIDYLEDYENSIKKLSEKIPNEKVIHKLYIIYEAKTKIKFNANSNLLLDKMIIDFEGGAK
ncbi:MAG: hypothetical protein R3Y21_00420 [Mycoplasmatota bacterium]